MSDKVFFSLSFIGRLIRFDTEQPSEWALAEKLSEEIKEAFRIAWEDCAKAGVIPGRWRLEHVYWDAKAKRVYIDSFESPDDAGEDNTKDRELRFRMWDLER